MQLTFSRLLHPASGGQAPQPGRRLLIQVPSRPPGIFHACQATASGAGSTLTRSPRQLGRGSWQGPVKYLPDPGSQVALVHAAAGD